MPSRADVVQSFLNMFDRPHYLEIGVNRGETFHALRAARKVAVDPHFLFSQEEREPAPAAEYHEVTSDEYFGSIHDGRKFDVIYIDGLHTFEQTLKDLLSAQLALRDQGVVVIDDVIPNSFDASFPDFAQVVELRSRTRDLGVLWSADGSWMGDVYKVIFFVAQFMQQMSFATVSDNHGQSVLWRKPRTAAELPEADARAVSLLDFRDTILQRSVFRLAPLEDIVAEVINDYGLTDRYPAARPKSIDLPLQALFSIVEVPEQSLPMPRVSFAERMSEPVRAFQARAWGSSRPSQNIELHRLKNVYVVGQGVVFNEQGEVYDITTMKMGENEVLQATQIFREGRKDATLIRHYGPHLLCGQFGLPNYGHWLVEILPAVFLMQQEAPGERWTAYVPQMFEHMTSVVRDSLDLLGVDAAHRVEGDGRAAWFEELIIVTGMSHHGVFFLPVTAECLQAMAHSIEPDDGSEKVWISRLGDKRALACEAELNARLTVLGWRVLLPQEMTLRAQIAACKGAKVMAGVDGAGLTNMAFMPAGGAVTGFTPALMPDIFFYALAANRELAFHDVRCLTSEPEAGAIAWNVTLQLSADEVLELLV